MNEEIAALEGQLKLEAFKKLSPEALKKCLEGLALCQEGFCMADSAIQMKLEGNKTANVLHQLILQSFSLLEVIYMEIETKKIQLDFLEKIQKEKAKTEEKLIG